MPAQYFQQILVVSVQGFEQLKHFIKRCVNDIEVVLAERCFLEWANDCRRSSSDLANPFFAALQGGFPRFILIVTESVAARGSLNDVSAAVRVQGIQAWNESAEMTAEALPEYFQAFG